MIMNPSDAVPASMRQQQPGRPSDLAAAQSPIQPAPQVTRLLAERLELVEELWQTVLRSECPPGQAERLLRLKQLSEPEGDGDGAIDTGAIVQVIREMDLAEAIAAARAFSLYFQLVNILEQHIELTPINWETSLQRQASLEGFLNLSNAGTNPDSRLPAQLLFQPLSRAQVVCMSVSLKYPFHLQFFFFNKLD